MTNQDRRQDENLPMRIALMRLRLAEDSAIKILPKDDAAELAYAIQCVADMIRKQVESK